MTYDNFKDLTLSDNSSLAITAYMIGVLPSPSTAFTSAPAFRSRTINLWCPAKAAQEIGGIRQNSNCFANLAGTSKSYTALMLKKNHDFLAENDSCLLEILEFHEFFEVCFPLSSDTSCQICGQTFDWPAIRIGRSNVLPIGTELRLEIID